MEEEENIKNFQAWQKEQEIEMESDPSVFSRVLRGLSFLALGVTMILGCMVLLGSSNESSYLTNRDSFYSYGFICTLVYFVTAYWAMRLGKKAT